MVPGQEVLCPVVVEGRIDLLAVFIAAEKGRPCTWDDAADLWQLVHLAREVLCRLETSATVERYLQEVRAVRTTLREVSLATRLEEPVVAVAGGARRSLGAQGALVAAHSEEDSSRLTVVWESGLSRGLAESVVDAAGVLLRTPADDPLVPQLFESLGAVEALEDSGIELPGVEALIVAPLVSQARVVGALVLTWGSPRSFQVDERAMVEFFAGELALVLTGSRLFRRVADSQAELRGIVEAVAEGVASLDAQGRVRYISPRARELLGVNTAAPARRPFVDVVAPAHRSAMARLLSSALRGSTAEAATLQLGDRLVRVRVRATLLHDRSPAGYVFTFSDATSEETRRLQLEWVVATCSDAVMLLDPEDGTVVESNRAANRLLDLADECSDGAGQRPGGRRPWWRPVDEELLEKLRGGAAVRVEDRLRTADGGELPFEAELKLEGQGENGRIVAVVSERRGGQPPGESGAGAYDEGGRVSDIRDLVDAVDENLAEQKNVLTAMVMQAQLARSSPAPDRWRSKIEAVGGLADRARRLLERTAEHILELKQDLGEAPPGEEPPATGRVAWIVSDHPEARRMVRNELERFGWTPYVVEPQWVDAADAGRGPPDIVVVELSSLSETEDAYRRARRANPGAMVILVAPTGSADAATALAEDDGLVIVETFPVGRALQNLLSRAPA